MFLFICLGRTTSFLSNPSRTKTWFCSACFVPRVTYHVGPAGTTHPWSVSTGCGSNLTTEVPNPLFSSLPCCSSVTVYRPSLRTAKGAFRT